MAVEILLAFVRSSAFFVTAKWVIPALIKRLDRTSKAGGKDWRVTAREFDAEDYEEVKDFVIQSANYLCTLKATYLSAITSYVYIGIALLCIYLDILLPWLSTLVLFAPVAFSFVGAKFYFNRKVKPLFSRLAIDAPKCKGLKACVESNMVGFVLYESVMGLGGDNDHVDIRLIYVKKAFRGGGIASGLLRQLKSQQETSIKAHLYDFTTASTHRLLGHCGFKLTSTTWNYAHFCLMRNQLFSYTFVNEKLDEVVTK